MSDYENQIQDILAEQEQALNEIDKQFHQPTFIERMKALFTGLSAPKDSREYKLARIEAQRLFAPAAAIVLPILLVGAMIALSSVVPDAPPEFAVDVIEAEEVEELEKPDDPPPPDEPLPPSDIVVDVDIPNVVPIDMPVLDAVTAQPQEVSSVLITKSPVVMKNILGSTRDAGTRGSLIRRGGGSQEGEAAVLRALRWLKKNQNSDGSWSRVKPAMTGLAILCFLSHGEVPGRSEEFGETVQRGLQYLISSYDGHRFKGTDGNEYAYLIAAYALCEAYGMTQNPNIRYVAESALKRMIEGQHPSGGWDYKMAQTDRDDTSFMGWAAQALKAAQMANMFSSDPEWKEKMNKAAKLSNNGFLKNGAAGGGFGYTGKGRAGLTGVGTLCMQFHGMAKHQQAQDSLKLMDAWKPGWFIDPDEIAKLKLGACLQYYYYYATQAKFHDGGKRWKEWNDIMLPAYINAQQIEKDAIEDMQGRLVDIGWWENIDNHGDRPVMDTCLAALQLMVYYRYLPTATADAVKIDEEILEAVATDANDIKINTGDL